MENRIILHIDMDAFFPAIEQRENPQFRGLPVVVGADPKQGRGRGGVSSASYEARKFGIHSAMPISQAYKLCPEAIYLPPNFELYSKVSGNIMEIMRGFSEVMEQVSLDEAYIDVSKNFTIVNKTSEKDVWKKAEEFAGKIRKAIWEQENLTCSCGVGPNKMIAKIACEKAKPDGILMVKADEAEVFLEPLDVQKIPGIGVKTAQILRASKLNTVGDLKRLSQDDMEELFGIRGEAMYWKVRGIDEAPVVAEREVKSVGKEHTFEQDTRDPELLIQTFEELSREVAREIEEEGFSFKTITVVCRFTGFETHTKSKTFKQPSKSSAVLRAEAMKLLLKFIVEKQKFIRLIGVRVAC